MLFRVETLDTHDMSNKCIQANFFVVMFYLTCIQLILLDSTLTPTSVKNTVAVTADVVSVESKAKINIGVNGIHIMSVESLNISELNRCCGYCNSCRECRE